MFRYGSDNKFVIRLGSDIIMKTFWFIIMMVTFINMTVTNFNAFRYRIKLVVHDKHEWVRVVNVAVAILTIISIMTPTVIFILMLLKNGVLNPVNIEEFHKIGGTWLGISIDKLKQNANYAYHPFTYAMFMCFCNALFSFKDVYDKITERNLRYQYIWYWFYTVLVHYLIRI